MSQIKTVLHQVNELKLMLIKGAILGISMQECYYAQWSFSKESAYRIASSMYRLSNPTQCWVARAPLS